MSPNAQPTRVESWRRYVSEKNLKEALRQVRSNKGSAGVDGMTVDKLGDYLKQHWPVIREQLLNGIYEPKPGAGPLCPASSDAGSAEAMESDVLPIQLWV